jgi:hypothetical protein|tara:strand:+ start:163 stop:771 length:609 start_codon:yes stop_codon:yes gene_type:complete
MLKNLEAERKEEAELVKLDVPDVEPLDNDFTDMQERKSDFSASFYGPLYSDDEAPSPPPELAEPEAVKDGYFYVFETHKHQFKEEVHDKMIRYYILTKKDAKGRQVLHRAAECGDKHFCTMICYEAKKLEFVDEIIDTKDSEGLTPLYLLAEVGYRKKYDEDDEEMALLHGLGKTVVEEVAIDRDNLNLDEEGAAAAAQAKQ